MSMSETYTSESSSENERGGWDIHTERLKRRPGCRQVVIRRGCLLVMRPREVKVEKIRKKEKNNAKEFTQFGSY